MVISLHFVLIPNKKIGPYRINNKMMGEVQLEIAGPLSLLFYKLSLKD